MKRKASDNDITEEKVSDSEREAYYSANFKEILRTVLKNSPEKHVLSDQAAKTANRFFELSEPHQQLYVRLFLRKRQWLRVCCIRYPDISPSMDLLARVLVEQGFLEGESLLADPAEVLGLLQVKELKALCKSLNLPTSVTGTQKAAMISSVLGHQATHRPLFGSSSSSFLATVSKRGKAVLGSCVRVAEGSADHFSRIMLLFSLSNSWVFEEEHSCQQIIYRMLQVKIGQVVYPDYDISVTRSLFASSQDFERFYAATKLEQMVLLATEKGVSPDDVTGGLSVKELAEIVRSELDDEVSRHAKGGQGGGSLPRFLLPFTAGYVNARTLGLCADHFEKSGRYEEACSLLRHLLSQDVFTSRRGKLWERLALNLDQHLGMKEECLDAVARALQDPHMRPHTRLTLLQRRQRVTRMSAMGKKKRRSTGVCPQPNEGEEEDAALVISDMPLRNAPEVFIQGKLCSSNSAALFVVSNQATSGSHTITRVEGYASHHYANQDGWPCIVHGEGSVFTTLFGLLMWDVIFAGGVDDVFRSPFQGAPLDLFTSEFSARRKELIESRLDWMREAEAEELQSEVVRIWNAHSGKACVGVNWELFATQDDTKMLAACVGGSLLGCICRQFSEDYAHSAGGLPDLTLWNPKTLQCKVNRLMIWH
eukprot:Em0017g180a